MLLLLCWPLYPQSPFGGPPLSWWPVFGRTVKADLLPCGRASQILPCCTAEVVSWWLGPFSYTVVQCGWDHSLLPHPSPKPGPTAMASISHLGSQNASLWTVEAACPSGLLNLPFLGVGAQCQHCLGPCVSPWCVWFFILLSLYSWDHGVHFMHLSSEVFWTQYWELCEVKISTSRVYRFHELIVIMNAFYKSNVVDLQFLLFILYQFICKFCDCLKRFLFISILFR